MIRSPLIYSIFVSSTSEDMGDYRARARDMILTHNMRPLEMEYFPAEADQTRNALHRYLDAADAVVLIAGARYGSRIGATSYVEWEYNEAVAKGIPVICLAMSGPARRLVPAVPEEERTRQERFIQRLKDSLKIAEFEPTGFEVALAGALNLLPGQFRKGAGLVRAAEYDLLAESAAVQVTNLTTHRSLLRLLSGVGLIGQSIRWHHEGEGRHVKSGAERAILDKLLDLVYAELANRPVTTRIIESLVRRLIERLHGFASASGFSPDSIGELEASIDELFGATLARLKATSIHSNHPALASYKGYWQHPELGPFFKRKNEQFLSRNAGEILRVYACDSIAESVAAEWFSATVIKQVSQGASVKVVQIDPRAIAGYEDFGIYEHDSGADQTSSYLLLAPKDHNQQRLGLATSVTADLPTVAAYSRKFDALWRQSAEPLAIIDSASSDAASHQMSQSHGEGRISDLFGRRIILRRMERLDTGEHLLAPSSGFVRKYQLPYAEALSSHLKLRFPDVKYLLYVGDTHKNDGTVIRNLQDIGWDASGFICEPVLGVGQLWFNGILYTNRWTDLVSYADRVRAKCGPNTMAIFDIDQTLWAPKGVHDTPLTSSRTRAITRLIDDYVDRPDSDVANRAKARIGPLYREISEVRCLPLTLDNEDFKAALCVFLSLNVLFDPHRLESSSREEGAAYFEEIGRLGPTYYATLIREKYLPSLLMQEPGRGEASITHFLMEALSAAQTYQYSLYGETNGVLVAKVVEHLREIFRETVGQAPIQYRMFRSRELEETLSLVGGRGGFEEQLVLSKPAWDFATWLKGRGAALTALSDRPDESTVSAAGDSLLDIPMTIFGKEIAPHLP